MIKQGSAVQICNEAGEFLLLKRGSGANHHAGLWESVGGHVEEGETFEQAAVREVFEEVGITISEDELELVYRKMFDDDERPSQYDVRIFRVQTDQTPVIKEPETFSDMRWVAREDIPGVSLAPYAENDFRELGIIT